MTALENTIGFRNFNDNIITYMYEIEYSQKQYDI